MKHFSLTGLCFALVAKSDPIKAPKVSAQETNVEQPLTEAIDHVWAGQRVFFDFVEQDNHQMIAYYDANRQWQQARLFSINVAL